MFKKQRQKPKFLRVFLRTIANDNPKNENTQTHRTLC